MCIKWFLIAIVLVTAISVNGEVATTQKPMPLVNNSTAAPVVATTAAPKPKVDILNSAICKRCSCDKDWKQLDCSKRNISSWFNSTEWSALQNGDLTFDIIKLEHNNLTTIPQLPDYPVKSLFLGFNQIASIAIGAFSNLTELTKLDLSHNKLTSKVMIPDVFKGKYSPSDYLPLGNMRELDLGNNELHTLNADLFDHLPKLELLVLCNNVFHVMDHASVIAISGLASLKTLDISYMELSKLPENVFHGTRDLENLIISGNLFTQIPNGIELAINLKSLVLDGNPLENFEKNNVFPVFKYLNYLRISYLPELKYIGKGAFSNLQNLTELVCSDNAKLSAIDEAAFANATNNPEIFSYPRLEKLELRNNNLTLLERGLVQRWDLINTLDLSYNPWNCDCDNSWLIHTLMTQINISTPNLTNNVNCNLPTAWKGLRLMELNENKKQLVCKTGGHTENGSMILVGLLVGVLVGIPITLGALVLYRRGCFGLRNRGNPAANRALYDRASFTDDFHI